MYERRGEPMLTRGQFAVRLARHLAIGLAVIALALWLGAAGYHWTEHLGWLDSVLNAAMILSGMGPLHNPVSVAGKLFATAYALFSGVVFLALTAVMLAPVMHRVVHHFHLQDATTDDGGDDDGEEDEAGDATRRPAKRRKKR